MALDMSADDCDRITSISAALPVSLTLLRAAVVAEGGSIRTDIPWFVSRVASRGTSSLRSAAIDRSEASCLVLGVTLPANTLIRFSLRISAEGFFDRLAFAADDQILIDDFSATFGNTLRDWEQLEYMVTNSFSYLSWCYAKDEDTSEGEDSGWLDALSFTVIEPLTRDLLCPALDMSADDCDRITSISAALPVSLTLLRAAVVAEGGSIRTDIPWFVSPVASRGTSSLRSAAIDRSEASCLVLGVTLPANTLIRFSLRISAEGFFDRLAFAADDQILIDDFSATTGHFRDWEQLEYRVTNSISYLSWCYLKDVSRNEGEDSGWLDALSFTVIEPLTKDLLCPALDMSADDCDRITRISAALPASLTSVRAAVVADGVSIRTDVPWFVSPVASRGTSSLRSAAINHSEASCLGLEVTLPANTLIRFSLRISSDGLYDLLGFAADDQILIDRFIATSGNTLRDWEQLEYLITNSISYLGWCYIKDEDTIGGEDRGWLDALSFTAIEPLTKDLLCPALDMSADDCDRITSISATLPASLTSVHAAVVADGRRSIRTAAPWFVSPVASRGTSSLRSAAIDHSEASCLVLGVTLPANTSIRFSLRISAEGFYDHLAFAADEQILIDRFSATSGNTLRDWAQLEYRVTNSISYLSWCYVKDGSRSEGEDSGWLDALSFTVIEPLTKDLLCPALDMSADDCDRITSISATLPVSLTSLHAAAVAGGVSIRTDVPWFVSPVAIRGTSSLRSAAIDHSQASCLVLGVTLPANTLIRFSLRISAEELYDYLGFVADDQTLIDNFSATSGNTLRDWEQLEYLITNSISYLGWCYVKDEDTIGGEDSGWLDALSFDIDAGRILALCSTLDFPPVQCPMIRSVTYEPAQTPWLTTTMGFVQGDSALISPPLDTGENSCLTLEFDSTLPSGSYLAFDWRTTSQSNRDILELQADSRRSRIRNMPRWQTETVALNDSITSIRWCYSLNSSEDRQTARAWLDNLQAVTPANRYAVQISVTQTPTVPPSRPDRFRFQVTVTAQSPLFPTPSDWVLIAGGIDNISTADSSYTLVFSGNSARVEVITTPGNPLLPSSMLFTLEDRPLLRGVAGTSLAVELPARRLEQLAISAPAAVAQTAVDAPIEIAVTVTATDDLNIPVSPRGLELLITDLNNARVSRSAFALNFTEGRAQTTVTVGLTSRGDAGNIEMSVSSGDIQSAARVTFIPIPRVLVSVSLSATDSNLVQTAENTPVMTELILTALDNYGDPIEAGNFSLQLSASNGAIIQPSSSLTVIIETSGTAQQIIEIDPQNDLDTVVTVQLLRGNLDEAVQLLPEGSLQIAVRALRVLRQLQLSLTNQVSPLRQIDPSLPIRARVQLIGLDQYDQPIAFPEVRLTVAVEPTATQVTLDPQRAASTEAEGVLLILEVVFSERQDTTITITIAGAVVTTNQLVVRALYDRRQPLQPLNLDDADTRVSELDLIVSLRWMTDPQGSTESLVANLTGTSTSVTTAGIDNLQQLFTEDIDRVDLNRDGRADQLDLRILLRYLSGSRGTALAEPAVSEDLIRLLLGR